MVFSRGLIVGILFLFLIYAKGYGQIGGQRSFEFLNLPANAITSGLGGVNISLVTEDPLMLLQNPALSDSIESQQLSLSYLGYFAGINQSNLSYVHEIKERLFNFGISYLDYGDFQGFDAAGNPTQSFQAKEYVMSIGTSHQAGLFTVGTNLKFAHSLIETFSSSALLLDIGGVFKPNNDHWTISLVAKNIGFFLADYRNTPSSQLPFDLQIGTSFKPKFQPFRFSISASNIIRENLAFRDAVLNPNESEPGFGESIFRRINIGTELFLGKNVKVLVGYNHRLRRELRLQQTAGGAGFSFGLFLKIKMFEITYARSTFHTAGGSNHLTLTTNFKKFKKTKL